MYKIYVDGALFMDSTLEEMQIESGTITRELNKAGSFKLSIYPDHPFYDSIRELKTIIEVYKDGVIEPVFRGRALYPEHDFYKKKTYTCEGHFNFLIDSIMRAFKGTYTPAELFRVFVENHNSQVEENKRFSVGEITVSGDPVLFESTSADTTQNVMKKHLLDNYGGYIVPRLNEGVWYIDYLEDFTEYGTQTIEFGENLTKFTRKDNYSDIVTALIPYGKDDITVASVNNNNDIIFDETGVSLYGTIVGTKKFDDISNKTTLLNTAKAYLADLVKKQIVIELNAIDLSLLDKSIAPLKIGTYSKIISEPHSLADWFLITKQTINLTDPTKDSVVLGGTFESFTEQTAGVGSVVKTIDNTVEKAVTNSPTIKTIEEKIENIETGGGGLPEVTDEDDGKILMVVDGAWSAETLNVYTGEYEITPTVDGMKLETAQTLMSDDLTVNAIPFYEVENTSGGNTVYIADEIEVE